MGITKGDSRATHHYLREEDMTCLIIYTASCRTVYYFTWQQCPDFRSTRSVTYQLKNIKNSILRNIVVHSESSSLFFLDNYVMIVVKYYLTKKYVVKNNDLILKGHHNQSDGLCYIFYTIKHRWAPKYDYQP